MSLISCPECTREISDAARSCPHCGFPIQKQDDPGKAQVLIEQTAKPIKKMMLTGAGIAFLGVAIAIIGGAVNVGAVPVGILVFVVGFGIAVAASFRQWWNHG